MKKYKIDLSKQLIIITIVSLLIMIISISLILPKSLEPFFEQTVFSYLSQPLNLSLNETSLNKGQDVAYIIYRNDGTYISSNYKKILNIDDYSKILKYTNEKQGSFTYKTHKYYYFKKFDNGNDVIAITNDNYIKMLRRDYLGIVIPIVIITYLIIIVLLTLWSRFIVNRLEKLKIKVDNINNPNINVIKNKYEFDDEIMLLDNTIDEMKEIILSQDKYKSEMYQNISHDFKTPITVIKSYIEAYRDNVENIDNVINVSEEQIQKLEKKVKTLLELNKITYLQNSYKNDEKINIYPTIESIVDKYKIINKNIKYEIKCDKKNILYNGNTDIWDSIVNNLLSNAIRYAKEKIVITIKNDNITFYNDGDKIDENVINNLFEPYKKGKKGENGIGLSIVKGNCNLIGYNVMAKNKKNGVEFIISKRN
ncbi:MAG: HAMP domain-containing histidine kinase [Bacilli bacterium]|nr:HAMP domain-containing histidine kinase [Bacilli bacterium]